MTDSEGQPATPRDLYEDAIGTWGENPQLDMAVEECSELITAISRLMRGRATTEEVAEEAADVKIMVGQLEVLLPDGEVETQYQRKLTRLRRRLEEADNDE